MKIAKWKTQPIFMRLFYETRKNTWFCFGLPTWRFLELWIWKLTGKAWSLQFLRVLAVPCCLKQDLVHKFRPSAWPLGAFPFAAPESHPASTISRAWTLKSNRHGSRSILKHVLHTPFSSPVLLTRVTWLEINAKSLMFGLKRKKVKAINISVASSSPVGEGGILR